MSERDKEIYKQIKLIEITKRALFNKQRHKTQLKLKYTHNLSPLTKFPIIKLGNQLIK